MLIRCEKCSTLYELDEKLLPAQGAPVQCSKCQFVFKAYPPAEPARAADGHDARDGRDGAPLAEAPSGEPPVAAPEIPLEREEDRPVPRAASSDLVREGGALAGSGAARPRPVSEASGDADARPPAGPEEPRFTADGRPIRKVPFPTSDAPPLGVRPTALRVPPSRGKPRIDPAVVVRWVVVAVILVAIAVGAALAWRTHRGRAARARALPGQSLVDPQNGSAGSQPRK